VRYPGPWVSAPGMWIPAKKRSCCSSAVSGAAFAPRVQADA
jgi:hypothetical protein